MLRDAASRRETVYYGDLATFADIHSRSGLQLGYIREFCRTRGLPWLPVIAVARATGLPSDPFWPDGMGIDLQAERPWFEAMRDAVFAYDWSQVEIDE